MIFKSSCIVFAMMLASLATTLQAKPAEPHSKVGSESQSNQQKTGEESLPVRHQLSKRHEHSGRKRRGFARWEVPPADYARFSIWRPPAYTLHRPYYIPVYGPAGQIPIFFPPQPFIRNVGVPPDNPFMGPQYLPPNQSTMKPPATTMSIGSRFGDENEDDDDRPIWPNNMPRKPASATGRPKPAGKVPTRLPNRKSTTEIPSLFHGSDKAKIPLNSIMSSEKDTDVAIDNIFGKSESAKTTTTAATTTNREQSLSGPGDCVWAVVSCCSTSSTRVAEACFEERGCPGPFWGTSPCDSQFAKDAIQAALEYYG